RTSGVAMGTSKRDQRASKKLAGEIALKAKADVEKQIKDGPAQQAMTLIEALKRHLETGVKHNNRRAFESKITRLTAKQPNGFGADTPLDQITSQMVTDWKDRMFREGVMQMVEGKGWVASGKPMKASTINAYLKVLHRVLVRAKRAWGTLK